MVALFIVALVAFIIIIMVVWGVINGLVTLPAESTGSLLERQGTGGSPFME